jgi:hypothetical protein
LINFIEQCLIIDPNQRVLATDLLKHNFLYN